MANEKDVNTVSSFTVFPQEWGDITKYYGLPTTARDSDIKLLRELREYYKDKRGEVLDFKLDIRPLGKMPEFKGITGAMRRLWKAGIVVRFAKAYHTISGRPQYFKFYIWEDCDGQLNRADRDDSESPIYFM